MRCPHCNAELKEWKKFCPKCGNRLPERQPEEGREPLAAAENPAEERPSEEQSEEGREPGDAAKNLAAERPEESWQAELESEEIEEIPAAARPSSRAAAPTASGARGKKKLLIPAIALAAVVLAGAVFFFMNYTKARKAQETLLAMMEGSETVSQWMDAEEERFEDYILTEEEAEQLDSLLEEGRGLKEKDYESQIQLVETVKALDSQVKTRLDTESGALLEELKNQDPGYASEEQKQQLSAYASQMETLIQNGEYRRLEPLAEEWRTYAATAAEKKTGYQVSVMQYDFTEYPTVRLYLDVQDSAGGVVKELAPNMFYVSERDAASGDFLNRQVQKAVQMNENERLNINLLADTSSSMAGSSMAAATSIMKNFLNTVQFSSGDQVKLTQFNSDIDKSGFFTGDQGTLNQIIDSYFPTGQTKLYDAIIYGVQDVAGQEGARCVIAFTDGMDVGSYNSSSDVIDVVSRYHIPVFIVRIGDSSSSAEDDALRRIAEASGGSFKNLAQFSSDMSDFYAQIYRQIKEYYVVEYETDSVQSVAQDKEIAVYVQKQDQGGEAVLSVNPGDKLFDSLLGSYLRSYILDMNNHSYYYLAEYVDDTVAADDKWSIQWQMQKQVTGGFSNVTAETLMDYRITEISVQDENTVRIKADENYDVIYDEVYSDLKSSSRDVAKDALQYVQDIYGYTELDDAARLRIWARVNQIPEYILKRGADGKWRFSQYAGDLALGEKRKVYDVEITYMP